MQLHSIRIYSQECIEILDLVPEDLIRRMRNWRAWKDGGGFRGGTSAGWTIDYGMRLDGYRETSMPILVAEAQQTQRALLELPDDLGCAVALFWLMGCDVSFRKLGADLGCTDKTAKARVIRGHQVLAGAIVEVQIPPGPRHHVNDVTP